MSRIILRILWVVIIFLFAVLQIYSLVKANYADVVTSILTVVILLALVIAYWLISRVTVTKKADNKKSEKEVENQEN